MAYPTITALPDAPQRTQEPDAFATTADTFVAALPDLVTEVNAAGDYIEEKAILVGNSFQGTYDAATTYALGDSVLYSGSYWISLQNSNTGNTPTSGSFWEEVNVTAPTGSTATASGAITTGDALAVTESGNVSAISEDDLTGTEVELQATNAKHNVRISYHSDGYVLMAWTNSTNTTLYFVAGTVSSGSAISWGTILSLSNSYNIMYIEPIESSQVTDPHWKVVTEGGTSKQLRIFKTTNGSTVTQVDSVGDQTADYGLFVAETSSTYPYATVWVDNYSRLETEFWRDNGSKYSQRFDSNSYTQGRNNADGRGVAVGVGNDKVLSMYTTYGQISTDVAIWERTSTFVFTQVGEDMFALANGKDRLWIDRLQYIKDLDVVLIYGFIQSPFSTDSPREAYTQEASLRVWVARVTDNNELIVGSSYALGRRPTRYGVYTNFEQVNKNLFVLPTAVNMYTGDSSAYQLGNTILFNAQGYTYYEIDPIGLSVKLHNSYLLDATNETADGTDVTYDPINNRIIAGYTDNGNSNRPTSLEIPRGVHPTSFVGIADATVSDGASISFSSKGTITESLSSLSAGDKYVVGYDGTISNTGHGIPVGQALTTTTLMVGE